VHTFQLIFNIWTGQHCPIEHTSFSSRQENTVLSVGTATEQCFGNSRNLVFYRWCTKD